MELKVVKHTQLWRVLMVALLALVGAAAADQPPSSAVAAPKQTLPGCPSICGSVEIPYPFGIGNSSIPDQPCFLEPSFELTCNNSKLYWGDVRVLHIDILQGQLDVSFYVSSYCNSPDDNRPTLQTAGFSISSKENKFVTVGCDSYGYLDSIYDGDSYYSTGCLTRCYGHHIMMDDRTCSGIGCCQVDIPSRMWNISLQASNFPNSTDSLGNCSYSFVVKNGSYTFLSSHLESFPYEEFPMVLDWTVGEANCTNASESRSDYACKGNSYCDDKDAEVGYRCRCKEGYEGNPYHPDGCIDIDECKRQNHTCIDENHCLNTVGSYNCFCPKGHGNGTREGGCYRRDKITKVIVGVGAALIVLLFAGTSLNFIYQKRKLIKLKEKFFQQNGGFILQQQLSKREDSSHTAQIFTEDQLKKATNNYDESLIIGRGGFGIVFKGFLADNRIVAIKKSKIIDASQIEQFINEVVVLSQINHRNVVKLLGCCLETEVPLLVYEFVSNGTLFNFIHTRRIMQHGKLV